MAHGTPDYGVTQGAATVYQVRDLGELAARLGSPITFDRRGDVVWWDDFECGFNHWSATPVGVGATAAISTTRARNGRSSCRLTPGNVVGNTTLIEHYQPKAVLSRFGFEFSFHREAANPMIYWTLEDYDGTNYRFFEVRLNTSLNDLQYRNAAGAFVTFDDSVSIGTNPTQFNTGKLVVDPTTGRYERFILNHRTYDLDQFTAQQVASAASPTRRLQVLIESIAANNFGIYVDDVILTENEPANG